MSHFPNQEWLSVIAQQNDSIFLSSISVTHLFLLSSADWWLSRTVVPFCLKLVYFIKLIILPSLHRKLSSIFQLPQRFPTTGSCQSWHAVHTDCSLAVLHNWEYLAAMMLPISRSHDSIKQYIIHLIGWKVFYDLTGKCFRFCPKLCLYLNFWAVSFPR